LLRVIKEGKNRQHLNGWILGSGMERKKKENVAADRVFPPLRSVYFSRSSTTGIRSGHSGGGDQGKERKYRKGGEKRDPGQT